MKQNKFIIPIIFFGISCQAQSISSSVISTAGKINNSASTQLNWTLGEPIVKLMTNTGTQISSGYHNQLNLQALSVEDNDINAFIKIYPNPTSDYLIISKPNVEDASINIYNELGQILLKYNVSLQENRIDISELSSGIYIVKIKNNNSQKSNTYKIIKK